MKGKEMKLRNVWIVMVFQCKWLVAQCCDFKKTVILTIHIANSLISN